LKQLSQLYDHNVGENFFNTSPVDQLLSVSVINSFIQKLLTSIDLSVLSEFFYQQLQNTLPLSALKIQLNHTDCNFGDLNKATNIKNLIYQNYDDTVATVRYGFTRTLATGDWKMLQQLHSLFRNPLRNALEHHKINQVAINDGLGHLQGDRVLLACAQTISRCLRDTDFAFRVGGDEFCCLLTDNDATVNELVVQRISQAIRHQPLLRKYNIRCRIGGANYQPEDTEQSLFSRADQAMYDAKRARHQTIHCN
jgi:diguanylate cyclase (GGDEF)-like protein